MNKPTPKHELVIHVCWNELHIYPATPDADEWIKTEAPAYGRLDKDMREFSGMYLLRVNPVYEALEVATYLANMNGADGEGAKVLVGTRQVYPEVRKTEQ